uniref:Uncharacterized protein n=1 Tax=Lactarius deliciosus TaxID=55514 RepID=A0A2Z4M9Z7_9AGAM|nr:hypothetical protein [Lactarius deliciosus]AWX52985.1 hypothetical protein [Lactarius deliciosus]
MMGNKLKNIMKNIYIELLKNTSNNEITLLKDINKLVKTEKNGKFQYFYISYFQINLIREFILNLDSNSFYTLIPMLSIYGKDEEPYLILSKQILITNYSSPEIINNYILKQLDQALIDFEFNLDNRFHCLIFKYKQIKILI